MSVLDNVLARLEGVKKSDGGFVARCPAHEDRHPSLSIGVGDDGRVLLNCHANCETADILAALKLEPSDLFERDERDEIVATYDYEDELGALLFQVVRKTGKRFVQRRPDGRGGWVWKIGNTRRVLYRLPRVLEGVAGGATVYVVEGEKDAEALEAAGVIATTSPMGAGKWRASYTKTLSGADVVVVADRDAAGREHAEKVVGSLAGVAKSVLLVEAAEGKDAADHLAAGHSVDDFVPVVGSPDPSAAEEAKRFVGEVPPLADLLDGLVVFLRRFVVMSPEQLAAVALWVVHTHAIDAADTAAYLGATSAEKRSGKTRTLEVLEFLVRTPLVTTNISDAALFRAIDQMKPTLLFDEIDAIFGPNARDREDLRSMLNAGYRRGALSFRMGGANKTDLIPFSVFAAKVFAGIGNLPDTIADRTIAIRLERRTSSERIERFRRREVEPDATRLRDQIAARADESIDDLLAARPELPDELDDRAQDVWEPLLAIADLAGDEWSDRARAAAVVLSTGAEREDESQGAQLLSDIRDVFDATERDRLPTADLIAELAKVEESPWGDWKQGKPLSPQALGKLLKPYRIKTMAVWVDGEKHRGYKAEQFEDAWLRVLGGRGGRGGRPESSSQDTPTTPTTPTTHHTNGSNGRIPPPGDDDFIAYLAEAHRAGHLTEAEAEQRWQTHELIKRDHALDDIDLG